MTLGGWYFSLGCLLSYLLITVTYYLVFQVSVKLFKASNRVHCRVTNAISIIEFYLIGYILSVNFHLQALLTFIRWSFSLNSVYCNRFCHLHKLFQLHNATVPDATFYGSEHKGMLNTTDQTYLHHKFVHNSYILFFTFLMAFIECTCTSEISSFPTVESILVFILPVSWKVTANIVLSLLTHVTGRSLHFILTYFISWGSPFLLTHTVAHAPIFWIMRLS